MPQIAKISLEKPQLHTQKSFSLKLVLVCKLTTVPQQLHDYEHTLCTLSIRNMQYEPMQYNRLEYFSSKSTNEFTQQNQNSQLLNIPIILIQLENILKVD